MSAASGLLASAAVLLAAWRRRPRPSRFDGLRPATPPADKARWRVPPILARLGGPLRRLAGRAPDPVLDRAAGRAVVALTAGALVASPVVGLALAVGVTVVPALRRRRARRDHEARIVVELPDIADLLLLAVDSGLTVRMALDAVASRPEGPVATAVGRAVHQVTLGRRVADALDDVHAELGEPVAGLVGVLADADRYGAPLHEPLERVAAELRLDRRRRAEEAARQVPVKLLFPLVFCVLPAFALLTVVPLLAGALPSLPD